MQSMGLQRQTRLSNWTTKSNETFLIQDHQALSLSNFQTLTGVIVTRSPLSQVYVLGTVLTALQGFYYSPVYLPWCFFKVLLGTKLQSDSFTVCNCRTSSMESVSCLHGRIRMLCPGPSTQQVLSTQLFSLASRWAHLLSKALKVCGYTKVGVPSKQITLRWRGKGG